MHSWDCVETVTIKRIASMEAMLTRAYYLVKATARVKHRYLEPKTGEAKILADKANIRPDLILRLSEIQSHMTVKEMMMAGGEFKRIKTTVLGQLRDWINRGGNGTLSDRSDFWRKLRSAHGSKLFQPVIIHK